MPGDDDTYLLGHDGTARRLHTGDLATLPQDSRHLTILDDIDPAGIGSARQAPGHRVVSRHPAAPLQGPAEDGISCIRRRVEDRHHLLDFFRGEDLRINAVQTNGVDPA